MISLLNTYGDEGDFLEQKGKIKWPPSLVILFGLLILIAIATYIIPAGEYDRVTNEATGRTVIVPGSYHRVEQTPVGPFRVFTRMFDGFVNGADVIFLIMFAAAWILSIMRGGAFDGGIKALLRKTRGQETLIIPVFFFTFALAGATYGEFETVYGLIPLFVALAMAVGWDPIVGMSMCFLAVCCGFASGVFNPFTVGIAHKFAELPLFSGWAYRWFCFFVLCSVNCWWVMRYAKKIKEDPSESLVADIDYSDMRMANADDAYDTPFTAMHKFQLLLLVVTIGVIVFGTLTFGWYLSEVSGMFLIMFLVNELLARRSMAEITQDLFDDCAIMVPAIVIVGVSRGVLQIMTAGHIVDSVIYGLNAPLVGLPSWAAAEGMLVVQNLINFFIPSGSGQATAIMPIMIPLADLSGVSRQVAVLAYHFGDGFSNMIWPTSVAIGCGIARVPLDRWWKFYLPGFGITFLCQMILIALAVAIGYK